MIKFRPYYDKDKATEWLNEMSAKGYTMVGFVGGFWRFDACAPGKYAYQVDISDRFFSVSTNYREFMEENQIEIVRCWGPWVFLRREASEGEFELYTDIDSSIEHYTKILRMFKLVTIVELLCFFIELCGAAAGYPSAVLFLFVIGALLIAMLHTIVKTREIIRELKEKKGEMCEGYGLRNGHVSAFLPCGLLLNALALLSQDFVSGFPIAANLKLALQIIAIVLMLIGIYRTRWVFRE